LKLPRTVSRPLQHPIHPDAVDAKILCGLVDRIRIWFLEAFFFLIPHDGDGLGAIEVLKEAGL